MRAATIRTPNKEPNDSTDAIKTTKITYTAYYHTFNPKYHANTANKMLDTAIISPASRPNQDTALETRQNCQPSESSQATEKQRRLMHTEQSQLSKLDQYISSTM